MRYLFFDLAATPPELTRRFLTKKTTTFQVGLPRPLGCRFDFGLYAVSSTTLLMQCTAGTGDPYLSFNIVGMDIQAGNGVLASELCRNQGGRRLFGSLGWVVHSMNPHTLRSSGTYIS